jgi:hypothetical protein
MFRMTVWTILLVGIVLGVTLKLEQTTSRAGRSQTDFRTDETAPISLFGPRFLAAELVCTTGDQGQAEVPAASIVVGQAMALATILQHVQFCAVPLHDMHFVKFGEIRAANFGGHPISPESPEISDPGAGTTPGYVIETYVTDGANQIVKIIWRVQFDGDYFHWYQAQILPALPADTASVAQPSNVPPSRTLSGYISGRDVDEDHLLVRIYPRYGQVVEIDAKQFREQGGSVPRRGDRDDYDFDVVQEGDRLILVGLRPHPPGDTTVAKPEEDLSWMDPDPANPLEQPDEGLPPPPLPKAKVRVTAEVGEDTDQYVGDNVDDTDNVDDGRPSVMTPTTPTTSAKPKKVALVLDAGDKYQLFPVPIADLMAGVTDKVAAWLRSVGFQVHRYSQFWGNTERPFKNKANLMLVLQQQVASLRSGDSFFLFVGAHSNPDSFALYDADGKNSEQVYWDEIAHALALVSDGVNVTVMLDGCKCGGAVKQFTYKPTTIITATDETHVEGGLKYITDLFAEDFLEAFEPKNKVKADLNGDGEVSLYEAFQWAKKQTWFKNPQYVEFTPQSQEPPPLPK